MDRDRGTFVDDQERVWHPRFGTRILMEATRALKITVGKITTGDIPLGDVIEITWYACRTEARERNLSKDDFLDSVLTLDLIPEVVLAFRESLQDAFPRLAKVLESLSEEVEKANPFVRGRQTTSSSLPSTQESIPSEQS